MLCLFSESSLRSLILYCRFPKTTIYRRCFVVCKNFQNINTLSYLIKFSSLLQAKSEEHPDNSDIRLKTYWSQHQRKLGIVIEIVYMYAKCFEYCV